jgi:hypothetical protein
MEENKANSIDTTIENANANSQEQVQGTQENENSTNTTTEGEQSVDYQKKFSDSSREAQRLYEENKKLKEELELKANAHIEQDTENLYPGFDTLDEESKNNIITFSNAVSQRAAEQLKKDPAYAFALKQYSENKYNSALDKTISKYPELASFKDEFKAKTYNPAVVPENIETILDDLAKIHLFDKAKEIGAKEAEEKLQRVDLERNSVGSKEPTVKRSLEDWSRMASENPAKFASLSKEYESDIKSGKI